jgi:hypothetical protein
MKNPNFSMVAISLITFSAATSYAQSGLTLNFSSIVGSPIVFGGSADTFNFTGVPLNLPNPSIPGGEQWQITSESGIPNDTAADFLFGAIDNGPFRYTDITTSGLFQSATVTGPLGNLYIADGTGGNLTGQVNFFDVSTYGKAGGFLNAQVQINLTDVVYSGSNPDLQYLTANQPGSVNLSFQFNPGLTLQQLSTGSQSFITSYSGSIAVSAVPEPSSLVMSALGGLGVLGLAFRSRKI